MLRSDDDDVNDDDAVDAAVDAVDAVDAVLRDGGRVGRAVLFAEDLDPGE